MRYLAPLVMLAALAFACAFPASTIALQQPYVGVIGCSNSGLIWKAYTYRSTREIAWNAAQSGHTLLAWAQPFSFTSHSKDVPLSFDENLAKYGATAVWYPLCIHSGDYSGTLDQQEASAWQDFLSFDALLRQRTAAPLYVTNTIANQPWCTADVPVIEAYVVDRAVNEGWAQRSSPDIPPASHPARDGCHFDPLLSTNVGDAAVSFLDQ